MASTRPPALPIELGSKKYTLTFDLDGFERAEDLTGINLFDGEQWDQVNSSAKIAKQLAYAFLATAHPELEGPDDLGKIMGLKEVRDFTQQLVDGMRQAMPELDEAMTEMEEGEGAEEEAPLAGAS